MLGANNEKASAKSRPFKGSKINPVRFLDLYMQQRYATITIYARDENSLQNSLQGRRVSSSKERELSSSR